MSAVPLNPLSNHGMHKLKRLSFAEELLFEQEWYDLIVIGIRRPDSMRPADMESLSATVSEYCGYVHAPYMAIYGMPVDYDPNETSSLEELQHRLAAKGNFFNSPLHIHSRPELFQAMIKVWSNELANNLNMFRLMEMAKQSTRTHLV